MSKPLCRCMFQGCGRRLSERNRSGYCRSHATTMRMNGGLPGMKLVDVRVAAEIAARLALYARANNRTLSEEASALLSDLIADDLAEEARAKAA